MLAFTARLDGRHQIGPCLTRIVFCHLATQVRIILDRDRTCTSSATAAPSSHTRRGCLKQSAETGNLLGTRDGSKRMLTRSNCRFGNNCRFAHPPGKHQQHAETETR